MNFSRAFDKTLTDCEISATWLARESGVSEVVISRFRTGVTNPTTKTIAQLLEPLSMEVRQYYFSLLLGTDIKPSIFEMYNQIEQMDSRELSKLLVVIADKLSALHNAAKSDEREREKVAL